MTEEIDIILASHEKPKLLIDCVECLYAHTDIPFRLTIVDDSTDPVVAIYLQQIQLTYPNILLIHSDTPYVHGNQIINIGLRNTKSGIVAYLGNSIRVDPHWSPMARQLFEMDEKLGIVGFKLLKQAGGIEHAGIYWEPWMPHHMNIGVDSPAQYYSFIREYKPDGLIRFAMGFALIMFRRQVFPDGLDEKTYLGFRGYDDVDICFDAAERGWKIVYCGVGSATHFAGATRHSGDPNYANECETNRQIFLNRWGGTEEAKKSVVISKILG